MRVKRPLNKIFVTQKFGYTEYAKNHQSLYRVYGGIHGGLDLRAPIGTPVYAIYDGFVVNDSSIGFGNYVRLVSLDGRYLSIYAHLSEYGVGNHEVRAGALLGYSGNTGATTAPHLHLELRDTRKGTTIKSQVIDPEPVIMSGVLLDDSDDNTVSKKELIKTLGRFIGVNYKETDPSFVGHFKNQNLESMINGFYEAHTEITKAGVISIIKKMKL